MKPKVKVIRSWRNFPSYTVQLQVGHQYFTFDCQTAKEDCQQYARMVRKALTNIGTKP